MSEANAIQSSHDVTDRTTLDHEKESHHGSPTYTSAISQAENVEDERHYIVGWRLYLLTFSLCLSLLLSTLETTIVSTSLVSIADALHGFDQSGWVVTSYLLTYTGFLIIYAKFSDIFGRKPMLLIALVLFTVFSIVCGLVNNMLELIIFRALQGVGGSGIYSIVMVIAPEMVPLQKIGKYMAIITSVFALASVLGPILGGVINSHGSWRWVFLLKWNFSSAAGKRDFMKGKKFYDGFWPETYLNLKQVVDETRPDFIFADYQVEAAKDVASECQTPLATMWPQMPWLMVPQKYIPGEPGMQQKCLTSEHATFFDRLYDETYILRSVIPFLDFLRWSRKMRRNTGVKTKPSTRAKKPDYLLFVNSFFGLEVPKDLPPLMQAIGPVLSDDYLPLGTELETFYSTHVRTIYIAFGTHVILKLPIIRILIQGLAAAIAATTIDSVIWALRPMAQKQIPMSSTIGHIPADPLLGNMTWYQLLMNQHSRFHFTSHAPQRAILAQSSTILFLTHAGPSSANEGLFAGVPMLTMGIYGDQLPNSMRLREAGVALSLDKDNFTAEETSAKIGQLVQDRGGCFGRNVLRMKRIANIAARRKELAADLVEEVLYDHELRFEQTPNQLGENLGGFEKQLGSPQGGVVHTNNSPRGLRQTRKEIRPMHLQTADMRISWWKRHNVDFWAVGFAMFLLGLGIVVIIVLAGVRIIKYTESCATVHSQRIILVTCQGLAISRLLYLTPYNNIFLDSDTIEIMMSEKLDPSNDLSPLQRLYHKAISSPHAITRAERNQIQCRPIPSEEDTLCLSATSYTFHALVQKAITEPSTLTDTEARILSDGANQPSEADINVTIAGFKAMPKEERDVMDEARNISADPQETEAKLKAWEVIDKRRAEKRAAARQEREAARAAPDQTRERVDQKKPWVKTLEQKGWAGWGFVCFRTSYGDDEAWRKMKDRFAAITTTALATVSATDAVKQTWKIQYVEDATLEGIAAEGLRERFKSLVEAGSISEGIRTDYFISADVTVVQCFQREGNSPIIPVWEAGFNPNESHVVGYPGAVAVPCSLLLATVYPMMLMGEPKPLQTLHLMAGG